MMVFILTSATEVRDGRTYRALMTSGAAPVSPTASMSPTKLDVLSEFHERVKAASVSFLLKSEGH